LHDRKNGQWGDFLGKVEIPEIGPKIHLAAAACQNHAALVLTDGKRTCFTPLVEVSNTAPGKTGLWLYQIGDRQEYDNFEVSPAEFAPAKREVKGLTTKAGPGAKKELPLVMHENPHVQPAVKIPEVTFLPGEDYKLPRFPAPQDWVMVLERVKP
jgi:hypothetical protein